MLRPKCFSINCHLMTIFGRTNQGGIKGNFRTMRSCLLMHQRILFCFQFFSFLEKYIACVSKMSFILLVTCLPGLNIEPRMATPRIKGKSCISNWKVITLHCFLILRVKVLIFLNYVYFIIYCVSRIGSCHAGQVKSAILETAFCSFRFIFGKINASPTLLHMKYLNFQHFSQQLFRSQNLISLPTLCVL